MNSVEVLQSALQTVPNFPKPGINFVDITPVLSDSHLLRKAVRELSIPFVQGNITKVIGVESRGFVMAPMIALELGASFVPVRKEGKLPRQTYSVSYDLEYGTDTIEMHTDSINPNDRVLVHDDVLATGGTCAAVEDLVDQSGAEIAGMTFLIELIKLEGRKRFRYQDMIHSVLKV